MWHLLRDRCLSPISAYHAEGVVTDTSDGVYIFRDNGADVLAVAYLDTVQRTRHFGLWSGQPNRIHCGQLDNRLGAHIVLDLLPRLGINCDVLLTVGEEVCRSTAQHFVPDKDYHWMVEFDRTGTDVVTYQYDSNPDWLEAIDGGGNELGVGSYSDIAELGHLAICGVNWGVGFYDYHFPGAYCVTSELLESVQRFCHFYRANAGAQFAHMEDDWSWWEGMEEDKEKQTDEDEWRTSFDKYCRDW